MLYRSVKRVLVVAGAFAAVAVIRRILGSRAGVGRGTADSLPAIGGDTWPPVPVNQDRRP